VAHWLKDDTRTGGDNQRPKDHIKHVQEFKQALTDAESAIKDSSVKLRDSVGLSTP